MQDNFWDDPRKRGHIYQFLALLGVFLVLRYLYGNAVDNLNRQNIASGLDFLSLEAGFEISESVIEYWSDNSYFKALSVGMLNTLKIALVGNLLALFLGTVVGVVSLSKNWALAKLARCYVEFLRNIPLLLQLILWYSIFIEGLPVVREALNPLPHTYISQRGIFFPLPAETLVLWGILIGCVCATVFCAILKKWDDRRRDLTGKNLPIFGISVGLLILFPLLSWIVQGAPTTLNVPRLQGLNFQGGLHLSPEFLALLAGLVLYTSAFMAEIVRAGILSVKKGQWEAAQSLGLNSTQTMRLVVMPQALRVIVPPITSQLLNLTKNSSLAVAIGYPDFVSVANTSLNQTGQAIELISLIMLVYLFFSLSTSLFMNWYNKRIVLVER